MHYSTAIGAIGALVAAGILWISSGRPDETSRLQNSPRETTNQDPSVATPPKERGHLILLVAGDARSLKVTHIFAKPSPYNPIRIDTDFEVVIFDVNQREIGRYPMDLSMFDLDPNNVGKPDEVVPVFGDTITTRKVEALINIPDLVEASFLVLERNKLPVGELRPADYDRLRDGEEGK